MTDLGKLIVGVGLPGSGKTSVLGVTAKLLGAEYFCEPEEDRWDRAVMERDKYGFIGALHWFRSQRVPNLFDARESADAGATVFLDTFYDKICVHYLGKPGMEWLLPPDYEYFDNFLQTATIDYERLPDADCIVFFDVSRTDWEKMLDARGRKLDSLVQILDTFHTTELFRTAALQYGRDKGVPVIIFENTWSSVEESAERLASILGSDMIER